jgi:aspartate/glutamate racemase
MNVNGHGSTNDVNRGAALVAAELYLTQLPDEAIKQIQTTDAREQDAIAAAILEELADERAWDEKFANSQDLLAKMAANVREDIRADQVRDVDQP